MPNGKPDLTVFVSITSGLWGMNFGVDTTVGGGWEYDGDGFTVELRELVCAKPVDPIGTWLLSMAFLYDWGE